MSRIQLGLNVSDLEATAGFHSTLFGVDLQHHDLSHHVSSPATVHPAAGSF